MKNISEKRTRVVLQNPGPGVPVGTGYTQSWIDLAPVAVQAHVTSAPRAERAAAGTVFATGDLVVTIWYHPQVTTKTRVLLPGSRILNVVSVDDPNDEHIELVLGCVEVVK